jgi:hypothetical protein
MQQIRICDLWGSSCPPRKTFLDLPHHVRQRIYVHVGVLVDFDIRYGLENRGSLICMMVVSEDNLVPAEQIPMTLNLPETCESVHDEVSI